MNEDKHKNIVATTFTVINRKRTVLLVDDEDLPLLQRQRSRMMNPYAEEVTS